MFTILLNHGIVTVLLSTMKLKQTIIDQLQADRSIQVKIMLHTEAHPVTVQRWIDQNKNNSPLTQYDMLLLLASEFDCKIQELVDTDEPIITRIIQK